MAQATGRVSVKVNGSTLRSKPGAKAKMGGIQRTYLGTDQQGTVYKETYVPGEISCTMFHMADTDLPALRDLKDGIVSFHCDTGRVYTMANAGTSEIGDLSDGEVEIKFGGDALK